VLLLGGGGGCYAYNRGYYGGPGHRLIRLFIVLLLLLGKGHRENMTMIAPQRTGAKPLALSGARTEVLWSYCETPSKFNAFDALRPLR
jgi:hypothetical protein